jgi:hypothetical protein
MGTAEIPTFISQLDTLPPKTAFAERMSRL